MALLLLSCPSALGEEINMDTNHNGAVTVHKGESVDLICSSGNDIKTCNFISATGLFMAFYPNATYPRIERANEGNSSLCGIRLSNITEQDHGVWRCMVYAADEDGEVSEGTADINVTVAPCNRGYHCTASCALVLNHKWSMEATSNPQLKSMLSEEIESLRCKDSTTGDVAAGLEKFCCSQTLAKQTEWSQCIDGQKQRCSLYETQTCVTNISATSTTAVTPTINATTTGTVRVWALM